MSALRSELAHVTGTVSCRRPGRERDGEAARTSRTGKEGQWRDERFKAKWKVWVGMKCLVFRAADATLVRLLQQMGLKKRKKKLS